MIAKPKKPTIAAVARDTGFSRQSVSAWVKDGLDLSDPEAVAARVALAEDRTTSREDIAAARLRKLTAEADRAELLVAKERGETVSLAVIEEVIARICSATKGSLKRLEADLPPMLEGLSAARMQKIIREKVDEVLTALADDLEKLGMDEETTTATR